MHTVRKTFLLLLVLATCLSRASAGVWTPEKIPMVHLEDSTRWVCNPDGILQESTLEVCDSLISVIQRVTGVQFVVVCVENLEGDDPYEFNKALFKRYGFGQKEQDNGLLLTLATLDRSYFLSTGKGMEGILPDALCKRIENQVFVPYLKEGKWDTGIYQMVVYIHNYLVSDDAYRKEMMQSLSASEADAPKEEKGGSNWWMWFMGILVAGGGAFFAWVNGLFDSKEKKRKRAEELERQRQEEYERTHVACPKCGGEHSLEFLRYNFPRVNGKLMKFSLWKCASCQHEEMRAEDTSWMKNGTYREKAKRRCTLCHASNGQQEVEKNEFTDTNGEEMCEVKWKCSRCGKTVVEIMTAASFYQQFVFDPYYLSSDGSYNSHDDDDDDGWFSGGSSSGSSGGSFGGGSYGGGGAGGRF